MFVLNALADTENDRIVTKADLVKHVRFYERINFGEYE